MGTGPVKRMMVLGRFQMCALSGRSETGCKTWVRIYLCRVRSVPTMNARVFPTGPGRMRDAESTEG